MQHNFSFSAQLEQFRQVDTDGATRLCAQRKQSKPTNNCSWHVTALHTQQDCLLDENSNSSLQARMTWQ